MVLILCEIKIEISKLNYNKSVFVFFFLLFQCAESIKIEIKPIFDCALSKEGMKLEEVMGNRTNSLNPRKTYVPWILVNGVREKNKIK